MDSEIDVQQQLEKVSCSKDLVELVSITPDSEKIIAYCARVSNPNNQLNHDSASKLLSYCIKNKHWSVFEQAHMTVQIKTSRGIAPQILRHRSFTFQEFSQRYAAVDEQTGLHIYAARRQDKKNRQNSIDDLSPEVLAEWIQRQNDNWKISFAHYKWALDNDIAKECARMVLPLGTATTMYMSGSIRSWIHYVDIRADSATQKEHRDIALAVKETFCRELPDIAKALGWITGA